MLLERLEGRAQVPHIQAFAVDARDLEALRAGLRSALEHGDLATVRTFWNDRHPGVERAARARRWRVPATTIEAVCEVFRRHPALDHQVEELLGRLGHETLDVAPEPWFELERSAWFLAMRAPDNMVMREISVEIAKDALGCLFAPNQPPESTGPAGDLVWAHDVRFFRDSGAEVTWDGIESCMVDRARYRDWCTGEEIDANPFAAGMNAARQIGFDDLVRLAVGSYVLSAGPAFYLDWPQSRPLVDPRWELLPLFRIDHCTPGANWFVIEGNALASAADVARATTSPVRWWDDAARQEDPPARTSSPERALFEWRGFDEVAEDLPIFRDRFVRLLEDSFASGGAVLVSEFWPNDQGEIRPPGTRAWGWPVDVR